VIDESDDYNTSIADWTEFRETYPSRPFCLLIPEGDDRPVDVPPDALNDPLFRNYSVNRNDSALDGWFSLCGLDNLGSANVPYLGLFVDSSGSMAKWEIAASYNE
jgi:hypothetical protein